jgi:hypothetical protein
MHWGETTRETKTRWADKVKMDLSEDGVVWTRLICYRNRDQRRVLVNRNISFSKILRLPVFTVQANGEIRLH